MAGIMDTLEIEMGGVFIWGRNDCCTGPANVSRAVSGVDVMHPLRDKYSTRLEAGKMIENLGGWVSMCSHLAKQAGYVLRSGDEREGDIVLMGHGIQAVGARGQMLGVMVDAQRVALKTARGFLITDKPKACFTWGAM